NIKATTGSTKKATFADVAGADEEKAEMAELVDFLKNPKKFEDIGARIPRGVLLLGPPGTGKTLLARAVAGEAGVPFFPISGSDFVEMFVGVGASRVRDLFEQAKKHAPSIVFIDEIDAVGRHRGSGLGGGHDEREQTLNQLLVEMDGFEENESVIVIAATNRRDILDPALLRPGRFDRQITVNYPDVKGREEILRVHKGKKPIGPDVDFHEIAKDTQGFTGADLENLLNEAAILAARANRKAIISEDIEEATMKVLAGPEKKSHIPTEADKKITAFHEAGHAVVAFHLKTQDRVQQVSVISRGLAAGMTWTRPNTEDNHMSRTKLLETIVMMMGGRAGEATALDDICTGASNDIERATKLAKNMVTKWGLSDALGPIAYGSENDEVFIGKDFGHVRDYSEEVAARIDAEVRKIVEAAYAKALQILSENRAQLDALAAFLLEFEKVNEDEFTAIMKGELTVDLRKAEEEQKRAAEKAAEEERARLQAEREAAEREAEAAREAAEAAEREEARKFREARRAEERAQRDALEAEMRDSAQKKRRSLLDGDDDMPKKRRSLLDEDDDASMKRRSMLDEDDDTPKKRRSMLDEDDDTPKKRRSMLDEDDDTPKKRRSMMDDDADTAPKNQDAAPEEDPDIIEARKFREARRAAERAQREAMEQGKPDNSQSKRSEAPKKPEESAPAAKPAEKPAVSDDTAPKRTSRQSLMEDDEDLFKPIELPVKTEQPAQSEPAPSQKKKYDDEDDFDDDFSDFFN
ncbi:MAG: ATP-dependent zinc metalloprotease FtsH, partial [Oscillospiraceae bacterium]|nr:ATP-dependent zinc metalloprotease FtsH [Oscillospiraceae bacterium]